MEFRESVRAQPESHYVAAAPHQPDEQALPPPSDSEAGSSDAQDSDPGPIETRRAAAGRQRGRRRPGRLGRGLINESELNQKTATEPGAGWPWPSGAGPTPSQANFNVSLSTRPRRHSY
jgi:hypothetical protein